VFREGVTIEPVLGVMGKIERRYDPHSLIAYMRVMIARTALMRRVAYCTVTSFTTVRMLFVDLFA
jgi:hypothetical protein